MAQGFAGPGQAVSVVGPAIAAGTQTATSGTVVFSNSNGISFGMSGSTRVTASYTVPVVSNALQAVGTATGSGTNTSRFAADDHVHAGVGAIGVSTMGNTLGDTGSYQGTILFAGLGVVTVSQSTGAGGQATINISAPAAAGDGFNRIAAGTQTAGSATTVLFADSNNVTFGMSGSSQVTASIPAGATATGNIGGIAAGTQTATSGTIHFANGNGITFGMSGSSQITASYTVPTQTVQPGIQSISAGTTRATTGEVVWSNSHNISFGLDGQTVTASASYAAETPFGISAGTQSVSTGTLVLSNSNGISFGMSGSSRVTASVDGIKSVSAGTTRVTNNEVVFSNANNVSFGANGQTITASASYPADQFLAVAGGTQTATSGTLVFSDSNGISFGMSGSTRMTASYTVPIVSNALQDIGTATGSGTNTSRFAADDHVHRGVLAVGASGGNTAGDTGSRFGVLVFAGGAGIVVSQATGAVTNTMSIVNSWSTATTASQVASANAIGANAGRFALEGHQHAGVAAAGVSTGGNTAGDTGTRQGTVVFAGAGAVTLSQATGANGSATVSISAPVQSTQPAIVGIAANGSTATTGTVLWNNLNGISFGFQAAGNSTNITASYTVPVVSNAIQSVGSATGSGTNTSRFAADDHVHAGVGAVGVSNTGNTLGNTGTSVGTWVLAASGGITASMSTGAAGVHTAWMSVPAGASATGNFGGIAAGTQTATSGTVVMSDSNGISFGLSGSTRLTASFDGIRSISAGTTSGGTSHLTLSNSNNVSFGLNAGVVTAQASISERISMFSKNMELQSNWTVQNAIFSLQRISIPLKHTATQWMLVMDLTGNSGSTGALSLSVGVYTMSGSTASLASSGSRQLSWTSGSATSASSLYGGQSGTRYRTLGFNASMAPGDYLIGLWARTTNDGTWRVFGAQRVSLVGGLDANETRLFLDGISTSSFSTAMPASIEVSLTEYNRTGASALRQPGFICAGTF